MTPEEFEEKNLRADMAVVEFNAKYGKRIVFLGTDSNRKGKVTGLIKYLSIDGLTPCSNPFAINKRPVNIADIQKASSILLMVNIELLCASQVVPLNVFLEANPLKTAPSPPNSIPVTANYPKAVSSNSMQKA